MPGRIPLESLAGIAWNPWPESNGITGRDHVESVAGIVWNLQKGRNTIMELKENQAALILEASADGESILWSWKGTEDLSCGCVRQNLQQCGT